MKKYKVTRRIVMEHYHVVEADNKIEAMEIAMEYGERTNLGCSYGADTQRAEIISETEYAEMRKTADNQF